MSGVEEWSSEAWRAGAVSWLDDQLERAGLERTGPVEQPHLRSWSTVLTAATTGGPVWLKAPGPDTAFEVPLYDLLWRVSPKHILEPIAVDVDRGWVLLPDGGSTAANDPDVGKTLVEILPQYGQLQRDLMSHVDTLLSVGIVDMRAPAMPTRFDDALAAAEPYATANGDPQDILPRVAAMRPTVESWCARLADAAVPASLDHNDLHPGNVFRSDGNARFYDWGDSVVAHPFASMLVALGMLPIILGVSADDPTVLRARDAYLEPFGDLASHRQLVEELELACWVAKIARVLTWDRAVRTDPDSAFADAPLACLGALLADSWIDQALPS